MGQKKIMSTLPLKYIEENALPLADAVSPRLLLFASAPTYGVPPLTGYHQSKDITSTKMTYTNTRVPQLLSEKTSVAKNCMHPLHSCITLAYPEIFSSICLSDNKPLAVIFKCTALYYCKYDPLL